ncbi:MAG: hypothetical protein HOP08_14395 [Cyclobacteriaceae bacterium]|nr:hypothetical protein [Cyclobacteriaceae bacterium]
MKKLLYLLFFIPVILNAQVKYEVKEFTGTVKSIDIGWGFAFERLKMEVSGVKAIFLFYPQYGKLMIDNFKPGDVATVRVNVNIKAAEAFSKLLATSTNPSKVEEYFFYRDYITEIKIGDAWVPLPEDKQQVFDMRTQRNRIFFGKRVEDLYKVNGYTRAVICEGGLVGSYPMAGAKYSINDIKINDRITFMGYKFTDNKPGVEYPNKDVKEVYHFWRLKNEEGFIKSFLYKQNSVCLGLVIETNEGDVRVSFPSNYAQRINKYATGKRMTFCRALQYSSFKEDKIMNPPELHAIISEADTLKIEEAGFYGGADVAHDHKPAVVSGKISKVNRSDRGGIMNVILGNDVYVEITYTTSEQLGKYLKKGIEMEVSGDERIKKEGEIYSEDYRIITPRKVKVDGKEFLLQ